jgi:Leucine-rich repeat (LRR) protein
VFYPLRVFQSHHQWFLPPTVLPSLSGLCSLEVLGLGACNLREGALPDDIGYLSSLRSLDLSQNNFVSLPKSINQLSELEMLVLEDCTMLESLPQVPSKVQTVYLNGCISLKTIPDPIELSSSKRSEFICLNCWELYNHNGQDSMGLTMLERYLQVFSYSNPSLFLSRSLSLYLSNILVLYGTGFFQSKTWIWYRCSRK